MNYEHAPLVGKAMVLLKGDDLFETLSLNLVPMDTADPTTLTGEASADKIVADRPAWESESLDLPGTPRYLLGYLDLLTWQSRAIRLLSGPDGSMRLTSMYMAQGPLIKKDIFFDPMVAYVRTKDYGTRPSA